MSEFWSETEDTPFSPRAHGRSFTKSKSRLQRTRSERLVDRPSLGAATFLLEPPPLLAPKQEHDSELFEEHPAVVPSPQYVRVRLQGRSVAGPDATLTFSLHTPSPPPSSQQTLGGTVNQPALPAQPYSPQAPCKLLSTWKTAKMRRGRACLRPIAKHSSQTHSSSTAGALGTHGLFRWLHGGGPGEAGPAERADQTRAASPLQACGQALASAVQALRELPSELAHAHPWLFERTAKHVSDSHAHHYHGADLPVDSSARLHADLGIAWPTLGLSMSGGEQAVTNWLLLWSEHGTPAQLPSGRQQAATKPLQPAASRPSGKPMPGQPGPNQQPAGGTAGTADSKLQESAAGGAGTSPGADVMAGLRPRTTGVGGQEAGPANVKSDGVTQRYGVVCVPLGVEQDTSEDRQLWRIFRDIDKDHNGVLDMGELTQALSTLGLPCSKEYLEDMMRQYDRNRDGAISFSEFKLYIKQRNKDLERAFRQFDMDGDGQISPNELEQALKAAKLPYVSHSAAEVRRMLGMLTEDASKGVSYSEFRRFASLLPHTQTTSGSHVLYAWANSSLWRQLAVDRAQADTYTDPLLIAAGGHHAAAAAAATQISSPNEAFLRLLVGGVAGVVSRTVIAPLERLRTLMMLSHEPRGLWESARLMWADGGFLGLFKGHLSTVIKVFPTSAIQFGVVDATKKAFQAMNNGEALTELHCFVAGCLAGGVACIVSHPLDTIRTQMSATVAGAPQRSMIQVARSLGLAGLYRGFGLSCLQEVIGNGLGFWTVDKACQIFRDLHQDRSPNAQERGLLAAVCAMFVMTCVMPLDVVVRRIQAQGSPGHPVLYHNALHAFQRIAEAEGVGAFYRGMLTTYMKTAPSMGAVYYFYDTFGKLSGVGGLNRYRTPLMT